MNSHIASNFESSQLVLHFRSKDDMEPRTASNRHAEYIDRAARMALKSTMTHKHGCVIVSDEGDIIATGYNRITTIMAHAFSVHAEVDALSKLKRKKTRHLGDGKCDMYVVRISSADKNSFDLKYSKPCEDCQKAIAKYGIRNVYYSTGYLN